MKKKIFLLLLSILISVHCFFTVIYNLPVNPFSKKHERIINGYMDPLFVQTWTLFAPDPVSVNNNLFLKYWSDNGKESKWINLSKYYQKQSRKYYLHPYSYKNSILTQLEDDIVSDIKKVNDLKKGNSKNVKFFYENEKIRNLYVFILEELKSKNINADRIQLLYQTEIFSDYAKNNDVKHISNFMPEVKRGVIEKYDRND
ncbi:TPA: hypothetical protein PI326_002583 [Staphylococcus aureus]|nr:hypothetical protein [Staphylococcus aureus]